MGLSSFCGIGGSNRTIVAKVSIHVFHRWLPIVRRIKCRRPQPAHPVGNILRPVGLLREGSCLSPNHDTRQIKPDASGSGAVYSNLSGPV